MSYHDHRGHVVAEDSSNLNQGRGLTNSIVHIDESPFQEVNEKEDIEKAISVVDSILEKQNCNPDFVK